MTQEENDEGTDAVVDDNENGIPDALEADEVEDGEPAFNVPLEDEAEEVSTDEVSEDDPGEQHEPVEDGK